MSDTLQVKLAERSYEIHFGANTLGLLRSRLLEYVAAGRKIAWVTDANLAHTQASLLQETFKDFPCLVLPAGEETKSLDNYGRVLDFMAEHRLDRSSLLVAVGGGVIGDLGGFAAASFLRGIDFVQVPTTLLSMVDSSVGGKTGINLSAGKNLVGAFHQPKAVYISTDLLLTLPEREFAAGMAEVIKYGLLGDLALFEQLERCPLKVNSPELASVIKRCCAIKAQIVEADERETAQEGGRALLNLGHTFGHAVEKVAGYGAYLHGEAVAIGTAAAARLSERLGLLSAEAVVRVEAVLSAHGLPVRLVQPLTYEALGQAMARDKKVRAGALRFVVLRSLGEAATQGGIDPAHAEVVFRTVGAE